MITTQNVTVSFGKKPLFEDVSVKFLPGNCYGVIGANGAGKSTFLKVLSGDLEPSSGEVIIPNQLRMAKLEQDQYKHDEQRVRDTVMAGYPRLYHLYQEREKLYAKSDFSEEDGVRAGVLEGEFSEINGYEAEAQVSTLLSGLGVADELHDKLMKEIEPSDKVRVLLAQALFGEPDILLLDEPTNNLDVETIAWLEDYLGRLDNLVIVVSHDRHFLNNVCTHMADIDFRKLKIYSGNYDFWIRASELAVQQRRDAAKKAGDKAKELRRFIERFSSNVAKARQATARKKMLDDLTLDDLPISTRKYPHIVFKPERPVGKVVLSVKNISKTLDGEVLFKNLSFIVQPGEKVAFVGQDGRPKTALFDILMGEMQPDEGEIEWGSTISTAYFPRDNDAFFQGVKLTLVDWLRQFTANMHEEDLRGFLGRMLFSGEEAQKSVDVLSGGEKVRCMLSKIMLSGANVFILDEPTNHLDLESITALNNGMEAVKDAVLLFSSHDRELVSTVANRIIEIHPNGVIDQMMPYEEYLINPRVKEERDALLGIK